MSREPSATISILVGWSPAFELTRFCWYFLVVSPLAALCLKYLGFVWAGLAFFVGLWPFPYRARWTAEGLEVSWLFVHECLRRSEIEAARLRTGFRYLRLFRYKLVLEIELERGRRAVIVAPRRTLEWLHWHITSELQRDDPAALSPPSAP